MKIELPYGNKNLSITLPADNVLKLEPHRSNVDPVKIALAAPLDSPPLKELVHFGQKVVIITSDIARPCPTEQLLTLVLNKELPPHNDWFWQRQPGAGGNPA